MPSAVPGLVRLSSRRVAPEAVVVAENLGVVAAGNKNIGWLDVAVDDAFGVRGIEGVGDLDAQVGKQVKREGAARNAITKGLAFEKLHDEKIAAGGFADVINGADARVIQRRGGAGFALKALERQRIFG